MLDGILKQFEETKKQMDLQLAQEVIEIADSNKQIKIICDGNGRMKDLSIAAELLNSENKEMLEDLIIELSNRAQEKARALQMDASKNNMGNLMPGGMDLGNLFGQ